MQAGGRFNMTMERVRCKRKGRQLAENRECCQGCTYFRVLIPASFRLSLHSVALQTRPDGGLVMQLIRPH